MRTPLVAAALIAWLGFWSDLAVAQTEAKTEKAGVTTLRSTVSDLEDDFLAKVTDAPEPEKICDAYEAALRKLIQEHPDRPEPFVGMLELFEKCETARTIRLLGEFLGREKLPGEIRETYEQVRRTADLVGKPLDLAFPAIDGREISFDRFKGRVVIVDFWATWCGPCVRDLPKLKNLLDELEPRGLTVIGVSFDDDRAKLEAFVKSRAISWPQIYPDPEGRALLKKTLGVSRNYLPMVFLIGRDGRVRYATNARFRLEEKVGVLLKE